MLYESSCFAGCKQFKLFKIRNKKSNKVEDYSIFIAYKKFTVNFIEPQTEAKESRRFQTNTATQSVKTKLTRSARNFSRMQNSNRRSVERRRSQSSST